MDDGERQRAPYILKDKGAPIDFAFPKEGAGYFTNYFEILKNSPHPKAAQLLVNFLVSPEAQLAIAEGVVAAPINRKVVIPDQLRGKVPLPDRWGSWCGSTMGRSTGSSTTGLTSGGGRSKASGERGGVAVAAPRTDDSAGASPR